MSSSSSTRRLSGAGVPARSRSTPKSVAKPKSTISERVAGISMADARKSIKENKSNTVWAAVALQDHFASQTKMLPSAHKMRQLAREKAKAKQLARPLMLPPEEDDDGDFGSRNESESNSGLNNQSERHNFDQRFPGVGRKVGRTEDVVDSAEQNQNRSHIPSASGGSGAVSSSSSKNARQEWEEQQYCREVKEYNASLSLAQRLNLVSKPEQPLTVDKWAEVQKASDARQDSDRPCSICLEDFCTRPQLLLSCSHVFHEECLRSYERFSSHKHCPLCRRSSYQARLHTGGIRVWKNKCASRIQKLFRGYSARKAAFDLVKGSGDVSAHPALRRKFVSKQVSNITSQIEEQQKETESEIDKLFAELDSNISASRTQMRENLQSLEELHGRAPVQLTQEDIPASKSDVDSEINESNPWLRAKRDVVKRNDDDCPICFSAMGILKKNKVSDSAVHCQPVSTRNKNEEQLDRRPVMLLSCSHVFHAACLRSFESFKVFEDLTCPMCRSGYEKTLWPRTPRQSKGKQLIDYVSRNKSAVGSTSKSAIQARLDKRAEEMNRRGSRRGASVGRASRFGGRG